MNPRPTRQQLVRVLCGLYVLCGPSIHCHVPAEAVAATLPRHERGIVSKALRRLVALGLVWEKSHGPGRKSYGLTREGVRLAREICGE